MSFAVRHLSVLAYAGGFTLWHYNAAPGREAVASDPGFFREAGDMVASGDMVLVTSPSGGRVLVLVQTPGGPQAIPLAG